MKRFAATLLNKTLFVLNLLLPHLESWVAPRNYPSRHAPVFIIGAPRSGSTLFYQVLVNRFQFGYLNNLHNRCFGFPYLLELLVGKRRPENYQVSYRSTHGNTEGPWDPSESGSFWYRWFRRKPQYVPLEAADPKRMGQMKRVVSGLISAFDAPILFKNMPCALRLQPLASAFPDAVFLVIRRDPLMTAQSLLETRQRIHGDLRKWWSMEPPDIEEIRRLEPEEQVVRQVSSIYGLIERDSARIGRERFLFVTYEEFCADVHAVTGRVQAFLASRGIEVGLRGEVPASFDISHAIRLDPSTVDRLKQAMDRQA